MFEPRAVSKKPDAPKKFQATVLIPPSVDLAPFRLALKAAVIDKFGGVVKLDPAKNPIKDAGLKVQHEGFLPGWFYVNALTKFLPPVYGPNNEALTDPASIWDGCWCRFHLNAYGWINELGGKGVSFGLNAVKLIRTDVKLVSAGAPTVDVFDGVEVTPDEMPAKDLPRTPTSGNPAAKPTAKTQAADDIFA